MKIPKEAKEITLAVLKHPELHWKSCWEDVSARPEFNCQCPLNDLINEILIAEEI
jgi:hypothetical protein